MMIRLLTFITFTLPFASPLLRAEAVTDHCSALIGTCEYYSCIEENRLSCGTGGYPLSYGLKYCNKLSDLEFSPARTEFNREVFPADGNVWRDEVRACLQTEMESFFEKESEVSCSSLRAFAFESHPRCYTQNVSFCELTPESVLKVGLTIDSADLISHESYRQVQETAHVCSAQLGERLKKETKLVNRLQLHKYKAIWDMIALDPSTVSDELSEPDNSPF